jgi:hypothetical protein
MWSFFLQVMRSIVSGERKEERKEQSPSDDLLEDLPDKRADLERAIQASQAMQCIEKVFSDDPEAMRTVVGIGAGWRGSELMAFAQIANKRRLATTIRRIRRRLDELFPDGQS